MIETVEGTAAAVAPDAAFEPLDDLRDAPCEDAAGAPADGVSASYEVELKLGSADLDEVIEAARAHWTRQELEVAETQNADSEFPAVYAAGDGFNYSLVGARSRGVARVGGSTPCLLPADG